MEKARDCGAPCFSGSQQHSQALWPRGWSWGAGEACVGPKGLRAESDFPFGSPLWGCFCGGGNAGAWETSEEERLAQARQWMGGGGRREGHLGSAWTGISVWRGVRASKAWRNRLPPPRLLLFVSDHSDGELGQGPSRSKVTWAACWWPGSVWDLRPGCLKHPG